MSIDPGQVVVCKVLAKHPWGMMVEIDGAAAQGASIDMFQIGLPPRSYADIPEVGSVFRAVVIADRRDGLRLSHREDDVALGEATGQPPLRFRRDGKHQ